MLNPVTRPGSIPAPRSAPPNAKPATAKPAASAQDTLSLNSETWHYRGISSKFQVNWTSSDLQAGLAQDMSATEPTFSLRRQVTAPCQEGDFRCMGESQTTVQLRAQVGRTLGFQEASSGYLPGAAHDWASTTLKTVDMASGKPVALTDVFSKDALYEALMKDPLVKQELARGLSRGLFRAPKPANFEALVSFLDGRQSADGRHRFDRSMLENFTFENVQGNQVHVKMAVPYGVEVFRGTLTELNLTLPTKALTGFVSETDLRRAGDRTAGILGSEARKLKDRFTTIELPE